MMFIGRRIVCGLRKDLKIGGKTMKTNSVYRLELMQRALARSDRELHGKRHLYAACAFNLAARIIAGDYD
jgi:hypothetical protein